MHRRALVTGAAALSAMTALRRDMGAMAQSCVPAVAPAATIKPPVQVCVGNTEFALPNAFISDATNNSLNSRKLCFAPKLSDVTDIVLAFPGFGLINPEQDMPVPYTVKASVEYPIGTTPRQVFFSGATSVTVNPGRNLVRADPLPVTISAGKQFAVKTYVTWTGGAFWLTTCTACLMAGEWTTRGIGLPDHTLDNLAQVTTSNLGGFGPVVYGTLDTPTAVVGLVGDSWGALTGDWPDPSVGYYAWGRAMRGAIPFINLANGGDSDGNYFARPEGRNLVLRNGITHCIWEMGGNDLFGGGSIPLMISNLETAINPFLDRGVKCYAMTLTPRATSTDGWLTAQNQTPASLPVENVRIPYNIWLRSNWASIGLTGIFDVAHAVDPGDTGKWGFDPGGTIPVTSSCSGFATLSNGAIASVATAGYNGNSSAGQPYPPGSVAIPCMVYPYTNTGGGSGAVVNAISDPVHPWVSSFAVVNGGSGYGYPPMIASLGNWTGDGVHAISSGWNKILSVCTNIAPETFVL
jgi:hypothetical protein